MSRRTLTLLVSLAMCAGGLSIAATPVSAAAARHPIPGSRPAWATRSSRRRTTDTAQRLTIRVYLQLRDQAGAEATAAAVSDPASPGYRHFLSTAQVQARYAPAASSVAAVASWLRGAGMRVTEVPDNRQYVEATGTAAAVSKAFGVSLGDYAVDGTTLRAADQSLTVPDSLASTVVGVIGVDQSLNLLRPLHIGPDGQTPSARSLTTTRSSGRATAGTVPPPDGFRVGTPCSSYFGEKVATKLPPFAGFPSPFAYAPCGYTPSQLRKAYGTDKIVSQGLDGTGTTVAVIDAFASPTIFQDAKTYARRNDPTHPFRASQFSQVLFPTNSGLEGPDQCDAAGWYGEETLDIEAVHAMAPGAHIVYVGGSDCNDVSLDKALNRVVSKHLAQIVSNSYGDLGEDIPADEVAAFQQISIQAVLEGIGVYFSSGDSGDETVNGLPPSADFSASSPWVTAVGGTSLGIGRDGQRLFETGWETNKATLTDGAWVPSVLTNDSYVYGSGGGTSVLFPQPFYQRGVVPDRLAKKNQKGGRLGRVVPDISMVGDPNTGFLVGETQTFPNGVYYDEYRIGGTSLSSPLFAGVMALSDDLLGSPHGFINPTMYQQHGTASITDVRHVNLAEARSDFVNGVDGKDGKVTSLRTFDWQGLTIKTAPGYDDVTGLGVPNGLAFLFRP